MKHFLKLTTLVLVLTADLAFGAPKLSPDLKNLLPHTPVSAIVQLDRPPRDSHLQRLRGKGAVVISALPLVNGVIVVGRVHTLAALADDPGVSYVSLNRPLKSLLDHGAPTVGAELAKQYGWDGTGVGVAVIDSGVSPHPDLTGPRGSRIVHSESFLFDQSTGDRYGHGTHVAGVVGGNGQSSIGPSFTRMFRGIAPNVQLINLRVLDKDGNGTDAAVIAAIQRAVELKSRYNVRVINLSLGRAVYESYTQDPLCRAVQAAWKAGIVVVVAAGNGGRDNSRGTEGYGTITSPANDPHVITVGAMKTMSTASRADDQIASYSAKGPSLIDHVVKPDLVAPGNRTISLLADNSKIAFASPDNRVPASYYSKSPAAASSNAYFRLSGTSIAAPMVSGAAALLLQKEPGLTPDQVKARLMKTASKSFPTHSTATDSATGVTYHSQYDIFTVGAGYLDILAGLANSEAAAGDAMSPTAVYEPSSGSVYVVSGSTAV